MDIQLTPVSSDDTQVTMPPMSVAMLSRLSIPKTVMALPNTHAQDPSQKAPFTTFHQWWHESLHATPTPERPFAYKPLRDTPLTPETVIGVLCGGLSSEREVSLRSGQNCLDALHRLGFHRSVLIDANPTLPEQLKEAHVEVAFILLHGAYGEDGAVQGLLQWMGIPYTGSAIAAHAMALNKRTTKQFLRSQGIPVLPDTSWHQTTWQLQSEEARKLDIKRAIDAGQWKRYIVKPVTQGSSMGMSVVNDIDTWYQAIELGFQYDTELLVEPFIEGASLTVGVLEPRLGRLPFATPALELRVKEGWYDYKAKYTQGATEFILPAEIPQELSLVLQRLSVKSHLALGCLGASRIDWMIDTETQSPIMLEVNTLPGMTQTSDLPAQAETLGISFDTLVMTLLLSALAPHVPLDEKVHHAMTIQDTDQPSAS
ncbi:MAG: D-alanine--D-alanine ligase [Vampirovibrionales bacterium]